MVQYFSARSFASSSPAHGLLIIYCDPYAAAYHWPARDKTIPNNYIFWRFGPTKSPKIALKWPIFMLK